MCFPELELGGMISVMRPELPFIRGCISPPKGQCISVPILWLRLGIE